MNARYYDSSVGRFISQDSYRGEMDDAGTWHLYTYCTNDPINYVEPSGHIAVTMSFAAIWVAYGGYVIAAGKVMVWTGVAYVAYNDTKKLAKKLSNAKSKAKQKVQPKPKTDNKVKESDKIKKQQKKFSAEYSKGYSKVKAGLKSGIMSGLYDHALSGPRKGQRATKIPGVGKGKGNPRIVYEILKDGTILIVEYLKDHNQY